MQVKSRYGLVKLTYFGDNCCCICEDGDKTKMGLTDNILGIQLLARFKLKKIDKNFHYDNYPKKMLLLQAGGQAGQEVAPGHVKLVKRGNKMEVLL